MNSITLSPLPPRPLVSILMANHNYERYIGEAIQSVRDQTYPSFELLVCDDASTDNSVEEIRRYADNDSRLTLLERSVAAGQGSAFSDLFNLSSGEIVCFLDSDDRIPRHRLERIVTGFRANPSTGLISHSMRMIDEAGKTIGSMPFRTRLESGWIADRLIRRGGRITHMPFGGMALRREVAELAFPVPDQVRRHYADNYVNIVAAAVAEVDLIDEPLYDYRIHGSNAMQRMYRDREVTVDELEGMRRQAAAANERLSQLGYARDVIDLRRNLNFLQHEFLLRLFDGDDRWSLLRRYASLAAMLARDDLYFAGERLARIVIYGLAIPMPMPLRIWWLLVGRAPGRAVKRIRDCLWSAGRPISGSARPARGRTN